MVGNGLIPPPESNSFPISDSESNNRGSVVLWSTVLIFYNQFRTKVFLDRETQGYYVTSHEFDTLSAPDIDRSLVLVDEVGEGNSGVFVSKSVYIQLSDTVAVYTIIVLSSSEDLNLLLSGIEELAKDRMIFAAELVSR